MDLPVIFERDLYVLLPEVFLVLMICILLVFGAVHATNPWEGKVSKDLSSSMNYLTALTLFIGGFLSLNGSYGSGPLLHGTLFHDTMTATSKGVLFIVGGICLVVSKGYLRREEIKAFEYPLFILLATFGMGLLLSS